MDVTDTVALLRLERALICARIAFLERQMRLHRPAASPKRVIELRKPTRPARIVHHCRRTEA